MYRSVVQRPQGATCISTSLLAGALLAISPCAVPAHAQDAPSPAAVEGERLFETICVACHTIGGGVRIGPDLQGVTERREHAWLTRFISDPERLRTEGDSVAAANLARYGVRMPNLGLNQEQVEAVIAHLSGTTPAPAARPTLFLPTLLLALLAAAGITLVALSSATRRAEIRA